MVALRIGYAAARRLRIPEKYPLINCFFGLLKLNLLKWIFVALILVVLSRPLALFLAG